MRAIVKHTTRDQRLRARLRVPMRQRCSGFTRVYVVVETITDRKWNDQWDHVYLKLISVLGEEKRE